MNAREIRALRGRRRQRTKLAGLGARLGGALCRDAARRRHRGAGRGDRAAKSTPVRATRPVRRDAVRRCSPGDADFDRMLGNHDDLVRPPARRAAGRTRPRNARDERQRHLALAESARRRRQSRTRPSCRARRRAAGSLAAANAGGAARAPRAGPALAGAARCSRTPTASRCCRRATGGRSCARSGRRSCPRRCGRAAIAASARARAQVYLDVSGSMNAEMPLVIALLARRVALDPPAVLGVLRRGRAGGDRARPAQGADHRRHVDGAACWSTSRRRGRRRRSC